MRGLNLLLGLAALACCFFWPIGQPSARRPLRVYPAVAPASSSIAVAPASAPAAAAAAAPAATAVASIELELPPSEALDQPADPDQLPQPETITCARYAGPLRWNRFPGGRGPTKSLRSIETLERAPHLAAAPRTLVPFALADLRLAPGTPFARAAEVNAAYLRSLSLDRLLFSFRSTAGLPQPRGARPFGGWEAPGAGIRGHFVGHYLSALAAGGAGGDASLVEIARRALAELERCQRAYDARASGGATGYLAAFPPSEFAKVERHQTAWVPHYATHKVLAGLLALHTELRLPAALPLALGLGRWLWLRAESVVKSRGRAHWAELLNYEVGALAECFVQLATETGNRSWLVPAALFERECFLGPLAAAGSLHAPAAKSRAEPPFAQPEGERAAAAAAVNGLHANAHLAFALGAAARYEATGSSAARLAVDAFWRLIHGGHVGGHF